MINNYVVYILHGLGADSHANWFPWLKQQLKDKGYTVVVPDFPKAVVPQLDEWLQVMHSVVGEYGEGIIVGHSLGGLLAVQFLLHGGKAPKTILTATPFQPVEFIQEIDGFFPNKSELSKLKTKSDFIIVQADNDPYVDIKDGQGWADKLNGQLVMLPGLGHLTIEELPEILQYFA